MLAGLLTGLSLTLVVGVASAGEGEEYTTADEKDGYSVKFVDDLLQDLQQRLADANPGWAERHARIAPDGDADLPDDVMTHFAVAACVACGGVLMPDVVFFGGSVPRATLDAAWATFERAEALLVVGSSLAVFSGYRFVRRAAEHGVPVAIVNRGPTRGDPHAQIRVDAGAGDTLAALAAALR